MKNINICYVINNNKKFIDLTLNSINSLEKFYRGNEKLNFFILSETKLNLPKYITNIISPYKEIPLMHQRIYIPELLKVDRVIFLDSDTFVTTCISKLWKEDMGNKVIGMSPHYYIKDIGECITHFSLNKLLDSYSNINDQPYCNAGVQLLDCKKWLKNNLTDKCKNFFNIIRDTNHYQNEEFTYNIALREYLYLLDESWNYYPRDDFKRSKIIHYYGVYNKDKPKHNEIFSG